MTEAPTRPAAEHYVDPAPFDPDAAERITPEQERFYTASQWQMIWWRFRRHRSPSSRRCSSLALLRARR